MSMKNSNDTIGDRTRDLVAQCLKPTAPPRAPVVYIPWNSMEQPFFAHIGFVLEKVTMRHGVLKRILLSSPLITFPVHLHGALSATDVAAVQI
jgi:hypothetical protein